MVLNPIQCAVPHPCDAVTGAGLCRIIPGSQMSVSRVHLRAMASKPSGGFVRNFECDDGKRCRASRCFMQSSSVVFQRHHGVGFISISRVAMQSAAGELPDKRTTITCSYCSAAIFQKLQVFHGPCRSGVKIARSVRRKSPCFIAEIVACPAMPKIAMVCIRHHKRIEVTQPFWRLWNLLWSRSLLVAGMNSEYVWCRWFPASWLRVASQGFSKPRGFMVVSSVAI